MMRYIVGFVLLAVAGGAGLADDKADDEAKKLEGVWDMKALERRGQSINPPEGKSVTFVFGKDRKITLKEAGKPERTIRYKIDTSTSPKQLDLIELKDGKDGEVAEAIYELEGDTLRIGMSRGGGKGKRPTELKGDTIVILHLKRQKS